MNRHSFVPVEVLAVRLAFVCLARTHEGKPCVRESPSPDCRPAHEGVQQPLI